MADLIELDLVVRDKGLKQSVSTVERLERQLIKAAKAVEQNRISQDRYNKILLQSKREYQALGMSSQKATAQVRKFAEAQREAGRAAEYHQQQVGFAGKKVNRMGMQMQQAGYQVGDFAVQLQGGTNAAVALGQQGAQLLGIFGPAGAIAGAALAITTAFIAPLLSARKAAQDFVEELKEVTKELDLLRSGAASAGTLSLNQQIADTMNEIYDLENKTIDLRYAGAKTQAEILAIVVEHNKEEKDGLKLLQDKLRELLMAKDAIQIINGLMGDQVSEAENLREVERYNNQQRIAEQKELYKVAQKEASRRSKIREDDNASYAKDTLNQIKQWHSAYVKETERVEDESRDRRRDKEEAYIKDMAAFFLAAQERNRKLYYAQFSAEDALMSQDVVSGSIADRFGVSDLLNMGYTKEYLIAIGKMTDETKELEDGLTDAEKAAEKLREELEAPMVNAIESVSNAFGDFISNGLKDFKSFASSIVDSFKSMIAQMIATAARNKIMLSMGLGGSGFAAQAAAGNVAGVGGNAAFGPIGSFMGSFAGGGGAGTGVLGGIGSVFGTGGIGLGGSFGSLGTLLSGGSSVAAGGAGFAATLGAAIPAIAAVAVVVGLFTKKTKLLDSGLRTTVEGFDVAIETFKKTQTSRLFGLLKGSKKTAYEAASAEVADPLIEAIGNMQQSIVDAAGTLGIGANAFDDFSYQFKLSLKGLTEEEQLQKINEEITKMGDSFASLTGHFETMNELLEAANQRMQLQNRLDQLLGNNQAILARQREAELSAMHELNRPLAQMIYNLEDAQFALAQAEQAVGQAFAGLSASIEAEKNRLRDAFTSIVDGLKERLDVANEAMSRSSSIYSMLESAVSGRSVTSGISQSFSRREGALGFIRGGDFSDERKLEEALDVVAEPTEDLFGSFVDYARDFARTSITLEEAKKVAQVQLTADEKSVLLLEQQIAQAQVDLDAQLEALDKQYQMEVDQYNALLGIDTSVKSVTEAIGTLKSAIDGLVSAQAKAAAAASAAKAAASVGGAGAGGGSFAEQFGTGKKYEGYDLAALSGASDLIQAAAQAGVQTSGKTGAQIQQAISNATQMAVQLDNATRGKQFAMGGYHTGGIRMVGERGPEIEATGPSRIFSHNQTASMFKDPELVSEVRNLRSEVSGLRSEQRQMQASNVKYVKRNYDINRKWDTDGLPATRTS
jgi:hypothetical protein